MRIHSLPTPPRRLAGMPRGHWPHPPTPPPPSKPPTPPSTPPSSGGTSARRATVSPRLRASPAIPTPTTWAPRPAGSTRPPTAVCTGTRSSTTSPSSRSARWASPMSDPNIVWAGTGEGKIRSHVSVGQGIYKSTDAGATWTLMGLEQTGRIPRMVIHPTDPGTSCSRARSAIPTGRRPERGVFRTMDGGETWEHILFVDEDTGCSDIAMDPSNPRVLFAGTWQLEIHTWGRTSGGPGGGLHVSRDGGDSWTKLNGPANGIGLPQKPVGKVAVGIAPSNTDRVYAMLETGDGIPWEGQETEDGQLWRSGGRRAQLVAHHPEPQRHGTAALLLAGRHLPQRRGTRRTSSRPRSPPRPTADGRWTSHPPAPRARRRSSRHVDRPHRPRPHDRRARPGPLDLDQPGEDLVPATPHECADVPRHGRQRDPVTTCSATSRTSPRIAVRATAASRASDASPGSRGGCGTMWAGERVGGPPPDPTDPEHRVVVGVGVGHGGRHRGALRGGAAPVPCRRGLAGPEPGCGFRRALPLRVGRADPHLAARQQQRVTWAASMCTVPATGARAGR